MPLTFRHVALSGLTSVVAPTTAQESAPESTPASNSHVPSLQLFKVSSALLHTFCNLTSLGIFLGGDLRVEFLDSL